MATSEDSVPVFVRVRNSIRIVAVDPSNAEQNLKYVVQKVLEEFGRVSRREILAIQDYPKRGVYDVTFDGEGVFRSFMSILEGNLADPRLEGFKVFPHFAEEEVFLVVKSYSPFVPLKEIEAVIGRYCKKLSFAGKILNELGIWTSKYRFKAVFEKKGTYPPARFRLGTVNIDCFFSGMPDFCKRCRQYGHVTDGCVLCPNCGKEGHEVVNCSLPRKCHFCLQEGHLYSKCPQRKDKPEKIVKPAGKLTIVESVTSGEESEPRQVSQEGPTVKRTKKEEKTKEDGSSGSSRISTPAKSSKSVSKSVSKSLSKGEKLYQYYKDKPDREVREFFEEWSDEEDFDRIKGQMKGLTQNEIREMVLGHIRNLK
ncbi:uncharacterized protein LOC108645259 [Xenopus tropicalis]|uniref:Uncharacterized protein LOC108645259 n=1 Tax=Xenopus tropicalis TaxID=8364 RepID=A0A8J0T103_XENTR|nr:uncharacterized protein LOC108645259 [Xenopus tropicalis]|eukprot:XP_017945736.1 PREDICTED: uncharacterized protein LOC108645259 [Xenopus tropicalis]